MIGHELFTREHPSFDAVLSLRNRPLDFASIIKLLEQHRDEITKDYFDFADSADYLFCERAINLFDWHKDARACEIVYEIFEHVDEEDETLFGCCSTYLRNIVSVECGQFLFDKWKHYYHSGHHFEVEAFDLLIESGFENNEINKKAIEILWAEPGSDWLKSKIPLTLKNEVVQKEVKRRLSYIAPMVKYITAPREYNDYLEEWIELGSSWVEFNYKTDYLSLHGTSVDRDSDETFLIEILGNSDDRTLEMTMKRMSSFKFDKELIAKEVKERDEILNREFLDKLPADLSGWLNSLGVTKEHKEEFADEADLIQRMMTAKDNPTKNSNIGRNAPCPCNSGKKYKKCCGM